MSQRFRTLLGQLLFVMLASLSAHAETTTSWPTAGKVVVLPGFKEAPDSLRDYVKQIDGNASDTEYYGRLFTTADGFEFAAITRIYFEGAGVGRLFLRKDNKYSLVPLVDGDPKIGFYVSQICGEFDVSMDAQNLTCDFFGDAGESLSGQLQYRYMGKGVFVLTKSSHSYVSLTTKKTVKSAFKAKNLCKNYQVFECGN